MWFGVSSCSLAEVERRLNCGAVLDDTKDEDQVHAECEGC